MVRSRWRWRHAALSLPYVLALGGGAVLAGDGPPFSFHDVNVLGTSMDVQVTTPSAADAAKAHAVVLGEVERLRKILSTYDAGSEISQVNASKAPVRVSQELMDVLKRCEQWQAKTKGAYSAGMGELAAMWKDAEKRGRVPDAAAVAAAAAKLQKPLWKIDEAAHTVQRLGDVAINVDSLGKGYIAEQAAILGRQKVSSVRGIMVNIGGDIVALGGSKAAGAFTPWTVGVANPAGADNAPPLAELHVTGTSVATSGNYARGYVFGERHYSHLLDPRTGFPVDFKEDKAARVMSATVVSADNGAANALATALCVMPADEGLALARESSAECLLVMSDGSEKRSAGFNRLVDGGVRSEMTKAPAKTPEAAPAKGSASAEAVGGIFPKGYEVSIPLQLKPAKHHACCAVWIEDEKGEYVKTLMVWGNQPKYLRTMDAWWRMIKGRREVLASATRATRAAGKYPLAWDGTDESGKPVAEGKYRVMVQTSVWMDPPTTKGSATIVCAGGKATATIGATKHFEELTITYAAKGS